MTPATTHLTSIWTWICLCFFGAARQLLSGKEARPGPLPQRPPQATPRSGWRKPRSGRRGISSSWDSLLRGITMTFCLGFIDCPSFHDAPRRSCQIRTSSSSALPEKYKYHSVDEKIKHTTLHCYTAREQSLWWTSFFWTSGYAGPKAGLLLSLDFKRRSLQSLSARSASWTASSTGASAT